MRVCDYLVTEQKDEGKWQVECHSDPVFDGRELGWEGIGGWGRGVPRTSLNVSPVVGREAEQTSA